MKESFRKQLYVFLGLSVLIVYVIGSTGQDTGSNSGSSDKTFISAPKEPRVAIEGVKLDKKDSNAWAVVGKVRNLESYKIKGYVKIKFIDSNGDVVKTHSAYVNDLDLLEPGQAGNFEFFASPKDYDGVVNFKVIFVARK